MPQQGIDNRMNVRKLFSLNPFHIAAIVFYFSSIYREEIGFFGFVVCLVVGSVLVRRFHRGQELPPWVIVFFMLSFMDMEGEGTFYLAIIMGGTYIAKEIWADGAYRQRMWAKRHRGQMLVPPCPGRLNPYHVAAVVVLFVFCLTAGMTLELDFLDEQAFATWVKRFTFVFPYVGGAAVALLLGGYADRRFYRRRYSLNGYATFALGGLLVLVICLQKIPPV